MLEAAFYSNFYVVVSAVGNLAVITIMGLLYQSLALKLNNWENHRTQLEFDNSLIVKNFAFQFVNNYFTFFYIAYMKHLEDPIWQASDPCEQSCLPSIQIQLLVVFTGKTLGTKVTELAKPFVMSRLQRASKASGITAVVNAGVHALESIEEKAEQAVEDHVLANIGLVPKTAVENDNAKEKEHARALRDRVLPKAELAKLDNRWEKESHLLASTGTFDDFNQMVIQYGSLALFAPACPLAPLLAFINNCTEIRGDALKICRGFQRPWATVSVGIGSWFEMLRVLGMVSVFTNATMIAFVGSQLAEDGEQVIRLQEAFGITERVRHTADPCCPSPLPLPAAVEKNVCRMCHNAADCDGHIRYTARRLFGTRC